METTHGSSLSEISKNVDTKMKSFLSCIHVKMRNVLLGVLMLHPTLGQSQDLQVKANVAPMIGVNTETKKVMTGANLELFSLGNDERRVGAGITPAVYFDEKMMGKLGPSVQVTKKFTAGSEFRAILGSHGGQTFVGIGGKATLGGKKK